MIPDTFKHDDEPSDRDQYKSVFRCAHRRSCLSMNDGQENARVSAAEEGEVSSEAGTLLNVVPGSIRAKPELHEANKCSARNAVTR